MSRRSIAGACGLVLVLGLLTASSARPQPQSPQAPADALRQRLHDLEEKVQFAEDALTRRLEAQALFERLADVAVVDKVRYTGPPARVVKNPTAQGAGNRVIVHSHFNSSFVHNLRELLGQGYAVLAPDYRGSTGYGKEFYELIDYGGLEVEDVFAGKQWMLETYDNLDPDRVGIMGWSHGGMITLFNLFNHPQDYRVGYAGVPVSDLVARMGYKGQGYRELFSAPYHIGKTAEDDVNEYRRRSPAWNADKLQTPLLIHTTTNDEDVNVLEVEHLIQALTAAGKKFEHKIYKDAPGGHDFNRLDTKLARESRAEVYRFLAKYLNPPSPVK